MMKKEFWLFGLMILPAVFTYGTSCSQNSGDFYDSLLISDELKTEEIAEEIKRHNSQIAREGDKYLLIGPGRWGTRDPLTGIPVQWSDIANAKVIVEQGLPDFPLDASLGSHFFHNVTSMKVGYFAIPFQSADAFINFDILRQQDVIEEFKYSRHVRFKAPLTVWMDGKKQTSVVTY